MSPKTLAKARPPTRTRAPSASKKNFPVSPWALALVDARRAAGQTQAEVALECQTTRRTIVRWESDLAYPSSLARGDLLRWASKHAPTPQRERLFETFRATPEEIALIPPNEKPWAFDDDTCRSRIDRAIREAAERLDVRALDLRNAIDPVLEAIQASGLTVQTARGFVTTPLRAEMAEPAKATRPRI